MRSRLDLRWLLLDLLRAGLIVAVASFGAMIVRNVTDTLQAITHQSMTVAIVDRPNR